jgi:hypothetical protein
MQLDIYGLTVTITGAGPFTGTRSDGLVVSNATIAAVMSTFAAMAPASYVPPVVVPTTIDAYDFINRFTAAEQQAVQTAAQSAWQLQIWMTQLAAAEMVDVTSPKIAGGMATLVAAGLLTSARAAQILNLGTGSP